MKRNLLTLFVGALLLVIFVLLLFTYQVRQTEIALVTTFDKPSGYETEPGFKWKWPPPIQRVYKFDKRIQMFDQDKIEETLTQDRFNLIVQVYMGWTISKPDLFFSSFPGGKVSAAQPALESLLRSAKTDVIGRHPFSQFVSTNTNELKLAEIERQMLESVRAPASNNFGITVHFLGVKKLALPESVTQKVFDRMAAERKSEVEKLQGEGDAQASTIRTEADITRDQILATAQAEATRIKGEADAEALKYYAVFEQNPDLAVFLRELRALVEVNKERATLFIDANRMRPYELMTRPMTNALPSISTNPAQAQVTGEFPRPVDGGTTISKNAP